MPCTSTLHIPPGLCPENRVGLSGPVATAVVALSRAEAQLLAVQWLLSQRKAPNDSARGDLSDAGARLQERVASAARALRFVPGDDPALAGRLLRLQASSQSAVKDTSWVELPVAPAAISAAGEGFQLDAMGTPVVFTFDQAPYSHTVGLTSVRAVECERRLWLSMLIAACWIVVSVLALQTATRRLGAVLAPEQLIGLGLLWSLVVGPSLLGAAFVGAGVLWRSGRWVRIVRRWAQRPAGAQSSSSPLSSSQIS